MQSSTLMRACLGVVVATGMVAVVGCSTSSESKAVERRTSAVNTTEDLRKQLREADAQIVATQADLQTLSTQKTGKLDDTLGAFRSDISKNESHKERIDGKARALNEDTTSHLNEWGYEARTLTDEGLRQKSLDRQTQVKQQQDQLQLSLNEVRAAYASYIRELKDIANFASQDLTPSGLNALQGNTERATKAAQDLRQRMVNLDGRLNQFASAYRSDIPVPFGPSEHEAMPAGSEMKETAPTTREVK